MGRDTAHSRSVDARIGGVRAIGILLAVAGATSVGVHPATSRAEEPEQRPAKLPPLKVSVDKSKVNLKAHRLEVRLSRKPDRVQIKVFGESGAILADESHDFSGRSAGRPLVVRWSPSSDQPVAKIEIYGFDVHGYYSGVQLVPWSVRIPHEEVGFATDSAEIRPEEEPKLEASRRKIRTALDEHGDIGPITLFIAGHTDTKGSAEHNLQLSRRRARAIARWFRGHGLEIPIAYEGFGESVPAVGTRDEVDEPRNRRVDYVLSVEPPRFEKSGELPAWKGL